MTVQGLVASLNQVFFSVYPLVSNLILALLLLLTGILIAKGLGSLTTVAFKTVGLDNAAEKTGLVEILQKGNIKSNVSQLLGELVYWFIVFVVVIGVAGIFGLAVDSVLNSIFTYMGIVFLAALILGVGLFLASLISGIVRVIMSNLGLEGAKTASRIIYYIVIIFTFLAALGELGFSPDWTPQIGVILGMPALAAAIAFGLGCKDMAADFLYNLFKGK
ncbi:hypothetical protein A3H38_05355 [candidate division WOR-1 bacterium RIFCSPLOWO2_02_FULL_46_20]|uniref:Uncharacterized protein n=1 Tax=candidate division WOR-1 bacterium RIFCSPLOWO2_02_FULL_46_20 TaxID=1802567 RepID=A0A1F4R691_UNCSA|nr:MAG: hypothetical protein A3H38_05355 [candidate division WOR-1 bacterium RIFCSPLOWO2_02_FULL_46_20]